jgi:hsp20/alpha crystallin family protein
MPKTNATAPAINVLETETDYTVEVAAPGLSKDDFEVNINNDGDLTIKMEKKSDEKEQKAHYLRREFAYSKYEQTLILPDDVEKEHIAARVVNGVLTVTLPKIKVDVQKIARQITVG